MKKTIRAILVFAVASLMLASCKEDPTPPVAGFTVSNEAPVQWDQVTITSTATGADETTYAVTGGTFEMIDDVTVQFLEAKTYTITQMVTNADGTVEASQDVTVTEPDNTYTFDDTEYTIGTEDAPNAYWWEQLIYDEEFNPIGSFNYIRMLGDVDGQDNPNLLKLYPMAGPNALQATYTWSDSGDIGTYDAGVTAGYAGFSWDWTTIGNSGGDLVIELVYADATDSNNNVYDITLASYTLNYGNYDQNFSFVSEGTKDFSVSYRGVIDPIE